ncbi:hypothetical protein scyTo_0019824 [Scyliorhinus torazame]|uniref:CID domain-containing protein n=1 Tax=Scyliorhinus torazame TaxID=75743 RepID=A0A401PS37_SCYTO|nr:hypothetical protein [Scyliorhinus torazame]
MIYVIGEEQDRPGTRSQKRVETNCGNPLSCIELVVEITSLRIKGDPSIRKSVERIFTIWEQRSVYPEELIVDLRAALVGRKPAEFTKVKTVSNKARIVVKSKILAEFRHPVQSRTNPGEHPVGAQQDAGALCSGSARSIVVTSKCDGKHFCPIQQRSSKHLHPSGDEYRQSIGQKCSRY